MFVTLDRIASGELSGDNAMETARGVLKFLTEALPQHDVAEEALFVPLLLEHASGELRQALSMLRMQHADLERTLGELTDAINRLLDTGEVGDLGETLGPIRRAFHEHLSWEELEMFPLARRSLTQEQLRELALRMPHSQEQNV